MKKAIIKRVEKGKQQGQFRFVLKAANNEIIATSETYTRKYNCIKTVERHFPQFIIIDQTIAHANA